MATGNSHTAWCTQYGVLDRWMTDLKAEWLMRYSNTHTSAILAREQLAG